MLKREKSMNPWLKRIGAILKIKSTTTQPDNIFSNSIDRFSGLQLIKKHEEVMATARQCSFENK